MLTFLLNLIKTILLIGLIGFAFNYLLNKFNCFKENIKVKNIVLVIGSLLIYFMIVSCYIFYMTKTPTQKFSESIWKENYTERYKMIDNLIETNYLLGKSKSKIKSVFGEPNKILTKNDVWLYEVIGRTWSDFKIIKLKLYFKENYIIKFEKVENIN